jgi:hypothetical protein
MLEQYRLLPAEKLVDTLLHSVMEYCERPAPEDDITAVVVRLGTTAMQDVAHSH